MRLYGWNECIVVVRLLELRGAVVLIIGRIWIRTV
jgi:hypothetical protein